MGYEFDLSDGTGCMRNWQKISAFLIRLRYSSVIKGSVRDEKVMRK